MLDHESIRRLVLSREIPDRLIRDIGRLPRVRYVRLEAKGPRRMTPALYETLKLVARGYTSTEELAERLGIQEEAARGRVKRLLAYFDVANRAELVALCYRERIV